MTKTEVLSIPGFSPETCRAIVAYLRANSFSACGSADPTSIIRNEGKMSGIHDAANRVAGLLVPERTEEPKRQQTLYPDPSQNR